MFKLTVRFWQVGFIMDCVSFQSILIVSIASSFLRLMCLLVFWLIALLSLGLGVELGQV